MSHSEKAPFIIAEMSGNHNGSLDEALEIVRAAANSGVDAIKLQTYTADTITIDKEDGEFRIDDPNSLWYGESLHKLYDRAHTPWEWHAPIMELSRELDLLCFSSPFDFTAVDFLESLQVPMYKIASFEIVDIPLIRRVARTGKPVIISTGMATVAEIWEAVDAMYSEGNTQLTLLKCTSSYPASPADSNILTIPHMAQMFGCPIGLSDHTAGIGAAIAAVAHGATVIEKHITRQRSAGGVDADFSLEPSEFSDLVRETRIAKQSLGSVKYGPSDREKGSLIFRRSLYAVEDVAMGAPITAQNVRSIRPGLGLHPKFLPTLQGKKVNRDIQKGEPLSWDMIG